MTQTHLPESTAKNEVTVALVGCGLMGTAIGQRLLDVGMGLRPFDKDTTRTRELVDRGAIDSRSAADAASGAQIIILSLNTAAIVRAAVFGEGGVVEGAARGSLVVDMSSISPESTRELASEAATLGLHWLDCPLSGGVPRVATGDLTVMAGGSPADFEAARKVMSKLASNYNLMGPSGAGQVTKAINQVLAGINFQAIAEATQLALDNGVDAANIPRAISGGRADSALAQEFMAKMAQRDYSPSGRIDNMLKDMTAALDIAGASGTDTPALRLTAEIHQRLVSQGFGADDNAALMRQFDKPQ